MSSYLTGCYVFSRKLQIPFCNPNTVLKQRLQQTTDKQTKNRDIEKWERKDILDIF